MKYNNPYAQPEEDVGSYEQEEYPYEELDGTPPPQSPQPPANPYYKGIESAISEARNSLRQTKSQEDRALRSSIATFGNQIAAQPREKGFTNNLLTGMQAMGPAVSQYDAQEAMDENTNDAMAKYMLGQQADANKTRIQQEQYAARLEAQKENNRLTRETQQNQQNEMFRHHRATEDAQRDLIDYKTKKNEQNSFLDSMAPKIRTDSAFDKIGKETKSAAAFYAEADDVAKKYEELKKAMVAGGVDITSPLAFKNSIRSANNIFSSFSKDPVKRKIATLYADVQASNKRLMQTAEKALKDGALTNFTVKYGDNNDLFPNFNENFDIYEKKLDTLLHDARTGLEASELSLSLGRHINKQNYGKIKELMQQQENPNYLEDNTQQNTSGEGFDMTPDLNQEWVKVQAPSGTIKEVHIDDANILLQDPRYKRVQ